MNFNSKQQQAIDFYEGSCGVISAAGSGKSTVLLNRIKNLVKVHNVSEKDILAISFTRNTANELKQKLETMGLMMVNSGTFHSICASILAQEGIYLSQDKMIKEWQIEKLFHNNTKLVDIDDVTSFISYQKNYLKSYTDVFEEKDSNYSENDLRKYFKMYEEFKKKNKLHDYDDYLIWCYEVLKKNPRKYTYKFILVDEHQDSNLVQNLILEELCESGNLFAVYDFRQSLYKFRGANPEYCMNFDKDWDNATIINMDINYRSTKNIVKQANHFIKQYYGDYKHYSDSMAARDDTGIIKVNTYHSKEEEAKAVVNEIRKLLNAGADPKEIAVLYRLNDQSFYVENELRQNNIDYHIVNDSSFFKRKEITGVLAYLKLVVDTKDDGAMLDIFSFRNYPFMYFSNKVIGNIKKMSNDKDMSIYEAMKEVKYETSWQSDSVRTFMNIISKLRRQKKDTLTLVNAIIKAFQIEDYIRKKYSNEDEKAERLYSLEVLKSFIKTDDPEKFIEYVETTDKKKTKKNCLKLMTIHASKGLEFENVFLIGVEDNKFPHKKSDLLDEARLFYVGVTRPKDNLYISQIGDGNRFVREYGVVVEGG